LLLAVVVVLLVGVVPRLPHELAVVVEQVGSLSAA
jgi:hypothetical protein